MIWKLISRTSPISTDISFKTQECISSSLSDALKLISFLCGFLNKSHLQLLLNMSFHWCIRGPYCQRPVYVQFSGVWNLNPGFGSKGLVNSLFRILLFHWDINTIACYSIRLSPLAWLELWSWLAFHSAAVQMWRDQWSRWRRIPFAPPGTEGRETGWLANWVHAESMLDRWLLNNMYVTFQHGNSLIHIQWWPSLVLLAATFTLANTTLNKDESTLI